MKRFVDIKLIYKLILLCCCILLLCSCADYYFRHVAKTALSKEYKKQVTVQLDMKPSALTRITDFNNQLSRLNSLKNANFIDYKSSEQYLPGNKKSGGGMYRLEDNEGIVHFSDAPFVHISLLDKIKKYIDAETSSKDKTFLVIGTREINITGIKLINDNTREVEYTINVDWNELANCFNKADFEKRDTLTRKFTRYDDGWRLK